MYLVLQMRRTAAGMDQRFLLIGVLNLFSETDIARGASLSRRLIIQLALLDPKFHESPPLDPVLILIKLVRTFTNYFSQTDSL
jgi:hypothetical protein